MKTAKHIFYEVAGTAGAFASSSSISRFGNNYSFFLTPGALVSSFHTFTLHNLLTVFFALAGSIWLLISTLNFKSAQVIQGELGAAGSADVEGSRASNNYFAQIGMGVVGFTESIYVGSKFVLTNRCFICGYLEISLSMSII
jgi:hypothetical protein